MTLKNLKIAAALAAVFLLSGCVSGVPEPTVLKLNPPILNISAEAQSTVVVVNCDQAVSAELYDGSWAEVESITATGLNNSDLTLKVSLNPSDNLRSDTLYVKSGSMIKKAIIRQLGFSKLFSTSSFTLTGEQSTVLSVSCDGDWTIDVCDTKGAVSWLSAVPSKGSGHAEVKVSTLEPNYEFGDRNAFLKLNFSGGCHYITVTQKQTDALIADADRKDIGSEGGTIGVALQNNVDYTVSVYGNWIHPAPETKAVRKDSIFFTVDANTELGVRAGALIFSNGKVSETVAVYQAAPDVLVMTDKAVSFPYYGGVKTVAVRTNQEYEILVPEAVSSWLSVEFKDSRTDLLEVKAGENTADEGRSATITVRSKTGGISDSFSVIQTRAGLTPFMSEAPGLYGIGSSEEYVEYIEGAAQLSVGKGCTRIIDPASDRFVEISGYDGSAALDSECRVRIFQNWTDAMPSRAGYVMRVFKKENSRIWLVSDEGVSATVL